MSGAANDHDQHHGYDRRTGGGGRVLWGRVVILGLALLLMFVLGRCSAGAGADEEQEVQRLERRVEELEEDKRALEEELEAMGAGGTETEDDGERQEDGGDEDGGDDGDADEGDNGDEQDGEAEGASDTDEGDSGGAEGEARTHEVQPGESLYRLAERYYGDGDKFRVIAKANGLRTNDPLQPGQTLEIPPDPDA